MIGKRIIRETPITIAEALEILEGEGDRLEASQRMARDYAQKFAKIDGKTARQIKEELLKLGKLSERQIVMLINLMPKRKEEIELLFAKERVRLEDQDYETILQTLRRFSE
ncbi:MAG: RNA polymerase Rpb4 family protein [Candidatus Hadarchaeales archaeon]